MGQFDGEFAKSIKNIKLVFALIGIPIYMKNEVVTDRSRRLSLFHFILCSGFQFLLILSLLGYLTYGETFTFLILTEVFPCTCFCIINFVKMVAVRSKLEDVAKLASELDRLLTMNEENEEAQEVVKTDLRSIKLSVVILIIINTFFLTFWNFSSLISMTIEYFMHGTVHKLLPYYLYIPWDTTKMMGYLYGYFYHLCAGNLTILGAIAPDAFFVAMASHIVLQFKLLQMKMEQNIKLIVPEKLQENMDIHHSYHDQLYNKMVEYVKIHKDLIELAETVEGIFTLSVLVNFLSSTIMICCVGFQITVIRGMKAVIFVIFMVTGLTQTLFVCNAGQKMIEESNAIGDAIYNSPWFLTDKKYRLMTFFVILRAQRPQVFTALRFSVVCLRSFASIMSSSYSYFTLLNTSYQK